MRWPFHSALLERRDGIPVWRRLIWLLLLATIAVSAGFFLFNAKEAESLIKQGGYFFIATLFTWWLWALWCLGGVERLHHASTWRVRLSHDTAQLVVLIAGLCAVAWLTTPRDHKVLFDEVIVQMTAWNMHMEREVACPHRAHEVEGLLRSLATYLDKRPYFYAFLVSLMHDVSGYRESNAFTLNSALLPVVLGLVYWLGRRLGGHGGGLAASAGVGAFSLLAINSAGAGLEMLNLALILGLMVAGVCYLKAPDERRLSVLVLTTVLLTNTRYESAIYVGCTGLIALEGWRRAGRAVLPMAVIFAPLLLVPYALHNTYLSGTPRLWELRDGATSRFGLKYLQENLAYAWEYFFNFGGMMANSPWLTCGGAIALVVLAYWGWRHKPRWVEWRPECSSVALVSLGIVGNLGLLMAYYWGDLSDPVVSRLSLPFHALLALLIAAAIGKLSSRVRAAASGWAVGLAITAYAVWGTSINQRLPQLNTFETAQRWEQEVIERRGPAKRLIVTDKSPLCWLTQGVSAVTPQRVRRKPASLLYHLQHHTFDEVLVTQTLHSAGPDGGFMTSAEHALPPGHVLEPIAERRIGGRLQRICVLREIKVEELKTVPVAPTNDLSDTLPDHI